MFRPTPMRRVNIFLDTDDVEGTTVSLARFGSLHISTEDGEEWQADAGEWGDLVDAHLDNRRRAARLLEIIDTPLPKEASGQPPEPSEHAQGLDAALQDAEEEILAFKRDLDEVHSRIKHLTAVISETELLGPLDVPLTEIRNPDYLSWIVGTMPMENVERLEITLFRIPVVVLAIELDEERALVLAVSSKNHGDLLERATRGVYLEPVELPDELEGTPAEVLAQARERLNDQEKKREQLLERRLKLKQRWSHRIGGLWRMARNSAQIATAVTRFSRHDSIYLISGWIPEGDVSELLIAVESASEGRADVELADAENGRKTPTKLDNPRSLRPFESIVATFGFPQYREADPTPVVALTFVLMYGMMFGDLGHGLIVGGIGAWLAARSSGQTRSVGTVLGVCGLSGAIFGLLYGSVLGREGIIPALWLSPLHDITRLLYTSVVGGIVVLNLGFLFNVITAARNRRWGRFFLDTYGLVGIALYWAIIGGGFAMVQGRIGVGAFLILVAVPAVLLFLSEPLRRLASGARPVIEGGIGLYAVRAFFELFEAVISDFSNTLSFVRLGAFAVAHAGLMHVVFSLSDLSGPVGRWTIIVIGSVVVIGLEGLVVAIQALRLQYYEFFGKFFSGEGAAYEPFRLSHN